MKNQTENATQKKGKSLVTIIVPFLNEETILKKTVNTLIKYVETVAKEFQFEILLVDDGSRDSSTEIAKEFAKEYSWIHVLTHSQNLGLGKAIQTGISFSKGDYVIVLDADLSYSPDHIMLLLKQITESDASIVIASPYMKGGQVSNVPWLRYKLSRWANRFLSFLSKSKVKTLTGMVRVYKGDFIRNLSLRSEGPEINPEIIYKADILDQKIEEIPGHLHWHWLDEEKPINKRSKLKIISHSSNTIIMGFFIKAFIFFIIPGLFILFFSIYSNIWMFIHIFEQYGKIHNLEGFPRLTEAFKVAYNEQPHSFLISFLSAMLAIQLISIGLISLQLKYYFEELFTLGTNELKKREE